MFILNKAPSSVGAIALLFSIFLLIFLMFTAKENEPHPLVRAIARGLFFAATCIVVLWIFGVL